MVVNELLTNISAGIKSILVDGYMTVNILRTTAIKYR
jgi:hypothetical protein